MSEFQIYDFRKIDGSLSDEEKKRVQALSSHIKVSSQRAVVSYSYGDFKHKVENVVADFFDAVLYQTNWGQKKLIFKFPIETVNYNELSEYQIDGSSQTGYITEIAVWKNSKYVFLKIEYCDDDFEGWIEDNNDNIENIIGLRNEIATGDYSSLYAFWLKLLSLSEENTLLPPIPQGINSRTLNCDNFIEYFEIDPKLIKCVASFIVDSKNIDLDKKIDGLGEMEKIDWLKRLLNSEKLLDVKFKNRLTETGKTNINPRLTIQEILEKLVKT